MDMFFSFFYLKVTNWSLVFMKSFGVRLIIITMYHIQNKTWKTRDVKKIIPN